MTTKPAPSRFSSRRSGSHGRWCCLCKQDCIHCHALQPLWRPQRLLQAQGVTLSLSQDTLPSLFPTLPVLLQWPRGDLHSCWRDAEVLAGEAVRPVRTHALPTSVRTYAGYIHALEEQGWGVLCLYRNRVPTVRSTLNSHGTLAAPPPPYRSRPGFQLANTCSAGDGIVSRATRFGSHARML